jgi:Holliday junction DNA helicase RuvB
VSVEPGKGIRTPGIEDDDVEVVIHDARAVGQDDDFDRSLRPPKLEDFVNQVQVTEQLGIFIEAARRREEALDHVLLAGPPGLGKTSLAHIIAAELNVPMVQTAGPALERKADIAAFLTSLEPGSVFFIDEIHRLGRAVEETLYPSERPPARGCSQPRCATALASHTGSSTTTHRICARSSCDRPASSASR